MITMTKHAMATVSDQPVWVIALCAVWLCLTMIILVRLISRK
jgi:hypothetical protein